MPPPNLLAREATRVVVESALKVKFWAKGKSRLDKPLYVVYFQVRTANERGGTNLPVPDRYVGAIFLYLRDPQHPMDDERTTFVRVATPEEFFTLPDFNLKFNPPETPAAPPAQFLSHSAIRMFDDPQEAVKWRDEVLRQVRDFGLALDRFILANGPALKFERQAITLIAGGDIVKKEDFGTPGVGDIPYMQVTRRATPPSS